MKKRNKAQDPERYSKLVTRYEIAELLTNAGHPITFSQLGKLASLGGGPEFYKIGNRCLYDPQTAVNWARSRLRGPFKNATEVKG